MTAGRQKPPGGFNWTHRTFWDDRKVRMMSRGARDVALYLLTCPDRASEGFFRCRLATLCGHLGMSSKRAQAALDELSRLDFARYDPVSGVVLITKALKYQAPAGPQQLRGAVSAIERVQDSPELFGLLLDAADRYAPDFADALRDYYGIAAG